MKAMVLAAGFGTRLKPITFEMPKPMVPVLDRPVMAHIVNLLYEQGFDELVANIHYFPQMISEYFGDRIVYRYEPQLLGTAGGVANARQFFGSEPVVVVSGDALTDIDLRGLVERHSQAGGVGTLAVKRVPDTREYGVVIADADGRVQGFQEKPDPAEALSELANCGIYCFSPEIFDYFPDQDEVDWAQDVFPALLENDVPFHVHEIDEYWNDVGSIAELRQATFDALAGRLRLPGFEPSADGVWIGSSTDSATFKQLDPPVWIGQGCEIGSEVRMMGPVVIGDGCRIESGASLRDTICFPGAHLGENELTIGAIRGPKQITQSLRPFAS